MKLFATRFFDAAFAQVLFLFASYPQRRSDLEIYFQYTFGEAAQEWNAPSPKHGMTKARAYNILPA